VTARRDDEAPLITFRITKPAIRAALPELPPLVYRDAHDVLTAALASTRDPARVRLPVQVAKELLLWLQAAAFRHKEARMPNAAALMEATESLQVAIRAARDS
jgi:hypothetical protein